MEIFEYHTQSIQINDHEKCFFLMEQKIQHALFLLASKEIQLKKQQKVVQIPLFNDLFNCTLLKNKDIVFYDYQIREDGIKNLVDEQILIDNGLYNKKLNTFFKQYASLEIETKLSSTQDLMNHLKKISIDDLLITNLIHVNSNKFATGLEMLDIYEKITHGLEENKNSQQILSMLSEKKTNVKRKF